MDAKVDAAAITLISNINWFKSTDLAANYHQREILVWSNYPKPKERFQTIGEPLNWEVWVGIVVSIALAALALYIISRMDLTGTVDRDMFTLWSIAVGTMVNEGLPDRVIRSSKNKAYKVLLFMWIPMACLICMAYQSNLLAALVKTSTEKPINSYQDILDRGIVIYVPMGTLARYLFASSPNPLVQKVYDEAIVGRGGLYDLDHGQVPESIMKEILEGRGVYDNLLLRVTGQRHELRVAKDIVVGTYQCGYYFSMNNKHLVGVESIFQHILEAGLPQKITDRNLWQFALPEREFYRTENVEEATKLSVEHLAAVFFLCVVMLVMAAGTLGYEKMKEAGKWDRKKDKVVFFAR